MTSGAARHDRPSAPTRGIGRRSAQLAGSQGVTQTSTLVAAIVYARVLGPADRGHYFLAVSVVYVLATFLSGGFGTYIVVAAGRREQNVDHLLGAAILLAGLAGAVSLGAGIVLWPALQTGPLRGLSLSTTLLALALVGFSILTVFLIELHVATDRVRQLAAVTVACQVTGDMLGALSVSVFHRGLGGALAGLATSAVLTPAALMASMHRFGARPRVRAKILADGVGYGLQRQLGLGAGFLLLRVDTLILNAYASAADVGIYSVAVAVGEKIWLLTGTLSQVAFPAVSGATADEATRTTAQISRHAVLLGIIAAGLMAVVALPAIPVVFGSPYAPAYWLLILLLPGIVIQPLTRAVDAYVAGFRRQPLASTAMTLFVFLLSLPIYLAAIRARGVVGAAAGSSIVYVVQAIVAAAVFGHVTRTPARRLVGGRTELSALITRGRRGVHIAASRGSATPRHDTDHESHARFYSGTSAVVTAQDRAVQQVLISGENEYDG